MLGKVSGLVPMVLMICTCAPSIRPPSTSSDGEGGWGHLQSSPLGKSISLRVPPGKKQPLSFSHVLHFSTSLASSSLSPWFGLRSPRSYLLCSAIGESSQQDLYHLWNIYLLPTGWKPTSSGWNQYNHLIPAPNAVFGPQKDPLSVWENDALDVSSV